MQEQRTYTDEINETRYILNNNSNIIKQTMDDIRNKNYLNVKASTNIEGFSQRYSIYTSSSIREGATTDLIKNNELNETRTVLDLNKKVLNLINDLNVHNNYLDVYNKVYSEGFSENMETSPPPSSVLTAIKKENDMLKREIKRTKDAYSTDDQRVKYESESLDTFQTMNNYMYVLYYALLLYLAIVLYLYIKNISKWPKILLVIVLFLFPMYIFKMETFVYFWLQYFYNLIFGNVYVNRY